MPRRPVGLRLVMDNCPAGVEIKSVKFTDLKGTQQFEVNELRIEGFGTLAGRASASFHGTCDKSESCLILYASPRLLAAIAHGGKLSLVIVVAPEQPERAQADETESNWSDYSRKALTRHTRELAREVSLLDEQLRKLYGSRSWRSTTWLREWGRRWRASRLSQLKRNLKRNAQRPNVPQSLPGTPVNIIVPVEAGFETVKSCLDSILQSGNQSKFELIAIDNDTTDERTKTLLRELADSKRVIVHRDRTKLGHTTSVSQAVNLHPERDFILLNSDTMVSGDWLDRLKKAAYSDSRIGTVTPLSNNATICSYPRMGERNHIPFDMSFDEMDELVRTTASGSVIEIPTAIGFCMYVKRECFRQVGGFEESLTDYGSEIVFCRQATLLGWKHVASGDVFIYNRDENGLRTAEIEKRARAKDQIARLYPDFEESIRSYGRVDSLKPVRTQIDLTRLQQHSRPTILLFSHGLGGGTDRHARELATLLDSQANFLMVRGTEEHTEIAWLNPEEGLRLEFNLHSQYPEFLALLRTLPIARAHIHHASSLGLFVKKVITDLSLPFDFTAHDYHAICPQIVLCDYQKKYCGQPDRAGCNQCMTVLPITTCTTIDDWYDRQRWLIEDAQRVFVPSHDTARRLTGYFKTREFIVTPHMDHEIRQEMPIPVARTVSKHNDLRIAILGSLGPEKGAELLDECAIDAVTRELPLEFHLLGSAYRRLAARPESALLAYGKYKDKDLQKLLGQIKPHLVWFPAQCPETYSYTLSAVLQAGLPVVVPDIGSFPERVKGRGWSWIVPWNQEAKAFNDFFCALKSNQLLTGEFGNRLETSTETNKPQGEFSYMRDYLTPVTNNAPGTAIRTGILSGAAR